MRRCVFLHLHGLRSNFLLCHSSFYFPLVLLLIICPFSNYLFVFLKVHHGESVFLAVDDHREITPRATVPLRRSDPEGVPSPLDDQGEIPPRATVPFRRSAPEGVPSPPIDLHTSHDISPAARDPGGTNRTSPPSSTKGTTTMATCLNSVPWWFLSVAASDSTSTPVQFPFSPPTHLHTSNNVSAVARDPGGTNRTRPSGTTTMATCLNSVPWWSSSVAAPDSTSPPPVLEAPSMCLPDTPSFLGHNGSPCPPPPRWHSTHLLHHHSSSTWNIWTR